MQRFIMVNNFTVTGTDENAQAAIDASRSRYAAPKPPSDAEADEALPQPEILVPVAQTIAVPVKAKRRI